MILLVVGAVAQACTATFEVHGFDPWLVHGEEVPTDARIVVRAEGGGGVYEAVLERTDTGELVEIYPDGSLHQSPGEGRITFLPVTELAPLTEYRVDVVDVQYDDEPIVELSTTFTTGAGPAGPAAAPPSSTSLTATDWAVTEAYVCQVGSDVIERTVSGALTVSEGLPPGTYVALRGPDASPDEFDLVTDLRGPTEIPFAVVQLENGDSPSDGSVARNCLVPVLILPNGDEVTGDEVCVDGVDEGVGCRTAPSGASSGWAVLMGWCLAWRRRRTVGAGDCLRTL